TRKQTSLTSRRREQKRKRGRKSPRASKKRCACLLVPAKGHFDLPYLHHVAFIQLVLRADVGAVDSDMALSILRRDIVLVFALGDHSGHVRRMAEQPAFQLDGSHLGAAD